MQNSRFALGAIAVVAACGAAQASFTVNQNSAVSFAGVDFDSIPLGSGIPNSNMEVAVNSAEGVEIGLKAIERFIGDVPTVGDTYFAPIGEGDPGLARWNYVWVADFGTRTLADFDVEFSVDFDPAFGAQNLTVIDVDFQAGLVGGAGVSQIGDSQNLGFSFWSALFGSPAFDANAIGEYDLELTVFEKGTSNVIAQSNVAVVVPAPGVAALAGVAGLGLVRRRR